MATHKELAAVHDDRMVKVDVNGKKYVGFIEYTKTGKSPVDLFYAVNTCLQVPGHGEHVFATADQIEVIR